MSKLGHCPRLAQPCSAAVADMQERRNAGAALNLSHCGPRCGGRARQVSVLFEADTLAHASPATVSRAGVVHFDVADLGWRPLAASWLARKAEPGLRAVLAELVDRWSQPASRWAHPQQRGQRAG